MATSDPEPNPLDDWLKRQQALEAEQRRATQLADWLRRQREYPPDPSEPPD